LWRPAQCRTLNATRGLMSVPVGFCITDWGIGGKALTAADVHAVARGQAT
jgi:hypothetical protein